MLSNEKLQSHQHVNFATSATLGHFTSILEITISSDNYQQDGIGKSSKITIEWLVFSPRHVSQIMLEYTTISPLAKSNRGNPAKFYSNFKRSNSF